MSPWPSPSGSSATATVAVVVLDNPPLNLFDEEVFAGWAHVVGELVALTDPGHADRARAVLVEARGKVVSGGVDVSLFQAIADDQEAVQRAGTLWARLLRVAQTLEDLPVPTVFAAHGLTLTASFEIALACDILLAAESASFGLVEIVVGLTPSMGGPQRLAERAGPARARELVFTGERYPAAVLERWNVVNRVLPDEGFAEAARAYARQVAAGPTVAHAATKRLVATAVRDGVRAADDAVPAALGRAVRHHRPARGGGVLPERRAREGGPPWTVNCCSRAATSTSCSTSGSTSRPHQARAVRRALPGDLRRRPRPVRADRHRALRAAQQERRRRTSRVRRRQGRVIPEVKAGAGRRSPRPA